MSTVTGNVTICPNIQTMLEDWFSKCRVMRRPSPLMDFVTSDINKSGIEFVVNPSKAKVRTVQAVYDQRIPLSQVTESSSTDKICTASTSRGDLSTNFTIDTDVRLYVEELFDARDWVDSCRENPEVLAKKIQIMLDGLMDKVAEQTAQEMNPLIGNWSDDVANAYTITADGFLQIATKLASSQTPDPQGFTTVDSSLMMTGFCDDVFIGGGVDFFNHWKIMQSGCCADSGVNLEQIMAQYGKFVAYDRWLGNTFGNDVSLVLQRGAVQMLTFAWGDADTAQAFPDLSHRNYFAGTITDPIWGIPVDLTVKDDCGKINIILECNAHPVAMPDDMFPTGDENEGVNYVTGVKVVNS